MSEYAIDAVDASMTTQPLPKAADASMITQPEATIPAVLEEKNPFDDVSPMSQHPEELDAKMQPENVPPEDQAASEQPKQQSSSQESPKDAEKEGAKEEAKKEAKVEAKEEEKQSPAETKQEEVTSPQEKQTPKPWEFEIKDGDKVTFEVPNNKRAAAILNGWLEVSVNLGDITNEDVDAITNAANEHLAHGAGVAGAIMRKGGYKVQEHSNAWVKKYGIVETGTAAWTLPGNIKNCKAIIHAVGPIWSDGRRDDEGLLYSCIRSTLIWASKLGFESVAIPAISSGIFGFPKPLCAQVLFKAAEDFTLNIKASGLDPLKAVKLRRIRFTNFDSETTIVFQKEFVNRYLSAPSKVEAEPIDVKTEPPKVEAEPPKKEEQPKQEGTDKKKSSLLSYFQKK